MASRTLHRTARLLMVFAAVAATAGATALFADVDGRTGRTVTGCTCHGSLANAGVTVGISGPQELTPGSVGAYTISVSGSPTQGGGFDLRTTAGAFTAGANSHLSGGELTHNNGASRSWAFTWTAPATAGSYSFYAVGVAANLNSSESGDLWNWYGGAANTPFTISVPTVGVDDEASPPALWLAAPWPNPSGGRANLAFSLANAGPAKLEAFDVSGRRVAVILSKVVPAGRRILTWDGRDARGRSVKPGVYLLRLTAEGRELTTRLTRLSK